MNGKSWEQMLTCLITDLYSTDSTEIKTNNNQYYSFSKNKIKKIHETAAEIVINTSFSNRLTGMGIGLGRERWILLRRMHDVIGSGCVGFISWRKGACSQCEVHLKLKSNPKLNPESSKLKKPVFVVDHLTNWSGNDYAYFQNFFSW